MRVRGEISPAIAGRIRRDTNFALKDEGARIDAAARGRTFGRMRIKPEEGLEVVAAGRSPPIRAAAPTRS